MSETDAKTYLDRLDHDVALKARVQAAADEAAKQMMEIARAEGLEMTDEELREAMFSKWDGAMPFARKADEDDPSTCIVPLSERPSR